MITLSSKLFNNQGYIPLKKYVEDIDVMIKHGPWKIPFGFGDSVHFFILKLVARFSWFSDFIFIEHKHSVSPAYSIILGYLKKKEIFDTFYERNLHYPGAYSFYLEKEIKVGGKSYLMSGQGVSEDISTAFSIAIGEMLERTISGMYDKNKDITVESPHVLMKNKTLVYPPTHHTFLDVQKKRFKELNHEPHKKIAWVKGESLVTQEEVYIPRQMTSWFSRVRTLGEVIIHTTTNGAAGYFTKEGATLRGILEVVQRDGFLVHWLTTIPPQVIEKHTLPLDMQERIRELEEFGLSIYVLDVTSLSIPSVFIAAISREAETPQVVVSGGSGLTFQEALRGALKEIIIGSEMFYYEKNLSDMEGIDTTIEPYASNIDKMSRLVYWRGVEKVKQFEWFISGRRTSYDEICKKNLVTYDDESQALSECVRVLQEKGKAYYPTVYFPKNSIQENLGFYIAQVFIPKAFPLYLFEGYGTFESERLREFAESKNIRDWKSNPLPHMFS